MDQGKKDGMKEGRKKQGANNGSLRAGRETVGLEAKWGRGKAFKMLPARTMSSATREGDKSFRVDLTRSG